MPVRVIAAKFGVHRGSIPKLVVVAGGRLRIPGLSDAARRRALVLYNDGFTLQEVAARLSVDEKTVRNAIVAQDGTIRPRGRRRNPN